MIDASIEQTALAALREAGLLVDAIEFDGVLHRVPTVNKPHGTNGAYIAHADQPVSIWWQDWQSDVAGTWTAKGQDKMTREERTVLKQRIETDRKAREEAEAARHKDAAEKAQQIYAAAVASSSHAYLERKGIKSVAGLKVSKDTKYDNLIVPVKNEQGKLAGLQFITPDGSKKFLSGTAKKGCFFSIGGKIADKPLIICEGLATGLSLYECTDYPVLVAFDAGNLQPAAEVARAKYYGRKIIIAADNDIHADGSANVGVEKATAAALAVDAFLAVPVSKHGGKCDWNDLHQAQGRADVWEQFQKAAKPEANTVSASEDKKPMPSLNCVNAFNFLKMTFPPREMLLAPVLPRQGLCMLHAQRGIGKTFVSTTVAYAVASGGKVFDRWEAEKPARVLFIDSEMPAVTLQERLARLIAGSDKQPPDNDYLRILTPDMQDGAMPNLATKEGQDAVSPFLEGVDLVVLDNLATLARHGRSNDEESWLPVQGWLLELRRRGLSVLMVHHQGKGGDQRGTSAKEDILDTVIRLDRPSDYNHEQGARFEIHLTKARGVFGADAKSFEAQLFTKGDTLIWTTKDIEDVELNQVKRLLDDGYSVRDVAAEMGITSSKVQRLKKKIEQGRISSSTVKTVRNDPLEVDNDHL